MATLPYEIIAEPYEVYTAPVGETFPLIDAAPAGNWTLLGTSGNKNHSNDGVQVAVDQSNVFHRVAGLTVPVKMTRTEEDVIFTVTIFDWSLEQVTKALGNATVTDNAASSGVAGFRQISFLRGITPAQLALLIRGVSPYGQGASADWNMQFEVYIASIDGNIASQFWKNDPPASVLFSFHALYDNANTRFVELLAQDADQLP